MASEFPGAPGKWGAYCSHAGSPVSFETHGCVDSPCDSRLAGQDPGRTHGLENSTLPVSLVPILKVAGKQAFQDPKMGLYCPVLWRMFYGLIFLFYFLHMSVLLTFMQVHPMCAVPSEGVGSLELELRMFVNCRD